MLVINAPNGSGVVLLSEDTHRDGVWIVGVAESDDSPSIGFACTTDRDEAERAAALLVDLEFWPEAHDGTVDWLAWAAHWLTDIAPDEVGGWVDDRIGA